MLYSIGPNFIFIAVVKLIVYDDLHGAFLSTNQCSLLLFNLVLSFSIKFDDVNTNFTLNFVTILFPDK